MTPSEMTSMETELKSLEERFSHLLRLFEPTKDFDEVKFHFYICEVIYGLKNVLDNLAHIKSLDYASWYKINNLERAERLIPNDHELDMAMLYLGEK